MSSLLFQSIHGGGGGGGGGGVCVCARVCVCMCVGGWGDGGWLGAMGCCRIGLRGRMLV